MTDLENEIADEIIKAWADQCKQAHADGKVRCWTAATREEVKTGTSVWLQPLIWRALVGTRAKLAARGGE